MTQHITSSILEPMLKIRLARIGRKNDPTFRVVVTEHTRGPKSGKHVEILGNYNPKTDTIALEGERILHWISNGAQVSDTVHNLLVGQGIISGKKINVLPKKSPIVKKIDSEAEKTKESAEESTSLETESEASADSNVEGEEATADETESQTPGGESKGEPSENVASGDPPVAMSTDRQDKAEIPPKSEGKEA